MKVREQFAPLFSLHLESIKLSIQGGPYPLWICKRCEIIFTSIFFCPFSRDPY
jgi:hypothetical protein